MDAVKTPRSCSRKFEATESQRVPGGGRQICIAITREEYDAIWSDAVKVRRCESPKFAESTNCCSARTLSREYFGRFFVGGMLA